MAIFNSYFDITRGYREPPSLLEKKWFPVPVPGKRLQHIDSTVFIPPDERQNVKETQSFWVHTMASFCH